MERNDVFITLIEKHTMNVFELQCGGYYKIESLASSRNCYFEKEEEIEKCISLFKRYLSSYIDVHKMYFSSSGYQVLLRVKGKKSIISTYLASCEKRGKKLCQRFIDEPWRILSEQFRIFHSVYAKWVNKLRDRSGGLVKSRFGRYYFESVSEFSTYYEEMEQGKEIISQQNKRYRVSRRWKMGVRWWLYRGIGNVGGSIIKAFPSYVVSNLVIFTKSLHPSPKPTPKPT